MYDQIQPPGDYCPYCGEPLIEYRMDEPTPSPQPQSYTQPQSYPPPPSYPPPQSYPPPPSHQSYPPPPSLSSLKLCLVHSSGKRFYINGDSSQNNTFYIGRHSSEGLSPDIDLTEIPYAKKISRNHAYVFWNSQTQQYTITDDGSRNGTFLNDKSLTAKRPYLLNNGDKLELAKEHLVQFAIEIYQE